MSVELLNRTRDLLAAGRAGDARVQLEATVNGGKANANVYAMLGYANQQSNRMPEALAALAAGLKRYPGDAALHEAMARMRWLNGEGEHFADDFLAAIARNPGDLSLRLKCADLLRLADMQDQAEGLLRDALKASADDVAVQAWLGVLLDETGRFQESERMFRAALRAYPNEPTLLLNLSHSLMRAGRAAEALEGILKVRRALPDHQLAITYEATALKQIGDPRYGWLCDFARHLKVYDLTPPSGFADIAEFNAAFGGFLRSLHGPPGYPLEQSLRGGSQTSSNLIHLSEPMMRTYFDALAAPVHDYISKLGSDARHPLEGRRKAQFTFSGCWSVLLRPGGFHVNHTHPMGWISSSYYVSLPASMSANSQEGWIKFGEPRWPIPGCGIERTVQPKEGRLVLFPSYMWHGTIPFSAGERLTAPFDVVPLEAGAAR